MPTPDTMTPYEQAKMLEAYDTSAILVPGLPAPEFSFRYGTALYPLPEDKQRWCGGNGVCSCPACLPFPMAVRLPACWDALAVYSDGQRRAVHAPYLQPGFLPE